MNALDQKIKGLLDEVDQATPAPPRFDEIKPLPFERAHRPVSAAAAALVAFGVAAIGVLIAGRPESTDRVRTESSDATVAEPTTTTTIETASTAEPTTSVSATVPSGGSPQLEYGTRAGGLLLAMGLAVVAVMVGLVAFLTWRVFNLSRRVGAGRRRLRLVVSASIAQLAAVGVVAITASSVAATIDDNNSFVPQLDVVVVEYGFDVGFSVLESEADSEIVVDPPARIAPELSPDARRALEAAVPDATIVPIPQVVYKEAAWIYPSGELVNENEGFESPELLQNVSVANSSVAQLLDLTPQQRVLLDRDGFVSTSPSSGGRRAINALDGPVEVSLDPSRAALDTTAQADGPTLTERVGHHFVSSDFVEANNIPTTTSRFILTKPTALSDAERADLDRLLTDDLLNDRTQGSDPGWTIRYDSPNFTRTTELVQGVISVVAILVVLARMVVGDRGRWFRTSLAPRSQRERTRRVLLYSIAIGIFVTVTGYSIALLGDEITTRNAFRVDTSFPTITAVCLVVIAPLLVTLLTRPWRQQPATAN